MPASISHQLTMTTPDNTAFENRPSHWNQSHLITFNAVGSEISGAFDNAGGVTFGLETNGSITASAPAGGGGLTNIRVSAGTTSNLLSAITFNNANGITFGLDASTITASHNGLTSQSNQALSGPNGSFTFQTAQFHNSHGISWSTTTGSGIIASHDGLTSQSNQAFSAAGGSSAFQTLGFSDNAYASFTNSNGSVAITELRASLFAVSNTTQSISGTQNIDAISFAGAGIASVGVTNGSVVISVPAGGGGGGIVAGVSTGGNTAGSTGTVSTGNFVLVGSNNITLSQSTGAAGSAATISIIGAGPFTMSSTEPYPFVGNSTNSQTLATGSTGNIHIFPFSLANYVSAGNLDIILSMNFTTVGTSSGRQTAGVMMGLSTKNGQTLSSIYSTAATWQVTGNNSTYSINQITSTNFTGYAATAQTSSAGVNITSGYTGLKLIGFPINSLMTPGVYWIGIMLTNSTSSINVGITAGYLGQVVNTGQTVLGPFGSFSSSFSSGSDMRGGHWRRGLGFYSTAGGFTTMPVSCDMSGVIPATNMSVQPAIRIWRT
jgi:hypothetical protein